jgi:hypothetical protein
MREIEQVLSAEEREQLLYLEKKMVETVDLDEGIRYQAKWMLLIEKAKVRIKKRE